MKFTTSVGLHTFTLNLLGPISILVRAGRKREKVDIAEARKLKVGDIICDCRFFHLKIVRLTQEKHDVDLWLEDGSNCSAVHCVSPANHEWEHPIGYVGRKVL